MHKYEHEQMSVQFIFHHIIIALTQQQQRKNYENNVRYDFESNDSNAHSRILQR